MVAIDNEIFLKLTAIPLTPRGETLKFRIIQRISFLPATGFWGFRDKLTFRSGLIFQLLQSFEKTFVSLSNNVYSVF